METKTENISAKQAAGKRKKLWEIHSGFHCSVLGTCLKNAGLRTLARKKVFNLSGKRSDFEIHTALVKSSATRSNATRALHKLLDDKFHAAVSKFSKLRTDEEVKNLWNQYVQNGMVPAAYWAVMTHPTVSDELISEIYGEVHMLSHGLFSKGQSERALIEDLRDKADTLSEVIKSERETYRDEKKRLEDEIAELRLQLQQNQQKDEEKELLRKEVAGLKNDLEESAIMLRVKDLEKDRKSLLAENQELKSHLQSMRIQAEENLELFELADRNVVELNDKYSRLNAERGELQKEISSLEKALLTRMIDNGVTQNCEECNSEDCPGPDLCGKTVLYVGGHHKMVPHYRQMIEKYGGRFSHHDGGKEVSRAMLPKLLSNADVVLCPVDCVSHYACLCVKQICKRYQKPYVMMRSSGLSSLAKGLQEAVQ